MKIEPHFKTKSLELFDDFLIFGKSRRKKIILYDEITNFTASYMKEQNFEQYTLNIYNGKWNEIKLSSYNSFNHQIIDFINKTITPIAIPKLMKRFNENEDMKSGLISFNKRDGIIKTNNVVRTIPWENIQSINYELHLNQPGQAKLYFTHKDKDEVFVFDFEKGNLKKHTFMIEIFRMMLGESKVTGS